MRWRRLMDSLFSVLFQMMMPLGFCALSSQDEE